MLSTENPINKPRSPPQFANTSVAPYNSDRFAVENCSSLKNITNRDGILLKINFCLSNIKCNKYLFIIYSVKSSSDSPNAFISFLNSNVACDISASYDNDVHAGKQLQS